MCNLMEFAPLLGISIDFRNSSLNIGCISALSSRADGVNDITLAYKGTYQGSRQRPIAKLNGAFKSLFSQTLIIGKLISIAYTLKSNQLTGLQTQQLMRLRTQKKRVPKQYPQEHYLTVHNMVPLGVLFWYPSDLRGTVLNYSFRAPLPAEAV